MEIEKLMDLTELLKHCTESKLPPVDKWNPSFCGDMDMVIKRNGDWFYQGSPIGRKKMVKLFSTILKKEDDDYFLVTPVEKIRIQVEDAPFVIVEYQFEGSGRSKKLLFRDNCDNAFYVGNEHPLWVNVDPVSGEPSPYCRVRNNLNALVGRSVFYDLVGHAEPQQDGAHTQLNLWLENHAYTLGNIDENSF